MMNDMRRKSPRDDEGRGRDDGALGEAADPTHTVAARATVGESGPDADQRARDDGHHDRGGDHPERAWDESIQDRSPAQQTE
jgi:hypothetical protein